MLGKIRLAERRGLLEGRNLSRVQEFGLEILIINETMDEAMADLQPSAMVPMRPDDDGAVVVEEVTEANVDDDDPNIVWKMPEMGRDEMLDLMSSVGQVGTMTAADPEFDKE